MDTGMENLLQLGSRLWLLEDDFGHPIPAETVNAIQHVPAKRRSDFFQGRTTRQDYFAGHFIGVNRGDAKVSQQLANGRFPRSDPACDS
jgi:hypothetical protein